MKKKFALCFRPVAIETDEPHHPSRAVAIAKVKNNNGTLPPSSTRPSFTEKSCGGQTSFPPTTNHSRKSISKGIRVEGVKINGEVDFQEKTNDLGERNGHLEKVEDHKWKRQANTISEDNKIVPTISSSSSSSSTSYSPSSSNVSLLSDQSSKDFKSLSMKRYIARTSSNTSFDKEKEANIGKTNDKTLDSSPLLPMQEKDFVFYWIVLALLAIILWGKIFAILLASMWLHFIPCRSGYQHLGPENNSGKLPEVVACTDDHCSRKYKKKVIIEGLFERKALLQQKTLKSLT